jgi:TolB-like protein/tRNA A-37 threonylcarbamoyl transferase component Bud32/tetratricopeptide (TPR) repeat protein
MADVRDQLQAALGNAFTIERELLGGAMSRVFVATETSLGRRVAIKVLSPELANAMSAERFRREIQMVAQLQHPHIVPVFTAGDADGLLYYTMPFVEGETLRARLQRDGKLPVAEALSLFIELADALAYAHGRGVVHRDIKPENVLLSGSSGQHATLADFGVSRALSAASGAGRLTTQGLVLGTPAYMAPEQIAGDSGADERADIYSLGLVAYEMFGGASPFEAKSPQALLAAHVTVAPRPLNALRSDLPPALAALVMRCLQKDPADRPQSAADLAAQLRSVGSGAHPARAVGTRRKRAVYVVAAVSFVAAFSAVYTVVHRAHAKAGAAAGVALTSIAVTPFVNAAGNSSDDYLADGITDELTSALGKTGLKVASRSSSFRFKGRKDLDDRQIGESLHVVAVLGGTMFSDGKTLRLTAHLTSTSDGSEIWSDKFDRAASGIFAMQDDLTREIMAKLNVTLKGTASGHGTQNLAAYDLYLRGRYFWNKRSKSALDSAIKVFNEAVALDSTYALAYAGLADSWALMGTFGYGPPAEEFPRGRAAAEHAIRLDSTLAEPHVSLGMVAEFYEWDWERATREFDRAEALNPNYASTYLFRGWVSALNGDYEATLALQQRALALEPLSLTINARIGTLMLILGRYADAERQLLATLALDSTFGIARIEMANLYAAKRDYARAVPFLPDVTRGVALGAASTAANVYGRTGHADELRKLIAELSALRAKQYVPADGVIAAYAQLGNLDAAFAELERAVQARDWSALIIGMYPEYAPLRADPRWGKIRSETHLAGVPSAPVPP